MLECVGECAYLASDGKTQEKFVNYPLYWKYCNNIDIVRIMAMAETCINTGFANMVYIIHIIRNVRIWKNNGNIWNAIPGLTK